jgi:type IV pilus assembly protein PilA
MQLKQIIHLLRKKKGFTLVELLAVIVILAVILVIAVPTVGRIIENSRQEAYLDDERMMEKAARTYALKKSEALPKGIGEKKVVLLSDLISSGILEEIRDLKIKIIGV